MEISQARSAGDGRTPPADEAVDAAARRPAGEPLLHGKARPFTWRQELPGQPVGADLAVAVLDIDADARPSRQIAGNRHQRDVARMRDVEIDARRVQGELGTSAHPLAERDVGSVDAEGS